LFFGHTGKSFRKIGGDYAANSQHPNSLRVIFPSGPDLIAP
jgi:hypothetical protein